jgi:hypothetical protein
MTTITEQIEEEISEENIDPKFRRFSSIGQFSGLVKHIRDQCKYHSKPLPTLTFSGSVKLHGTNAAYVCTPQDEIWFQSRERILSYESDNAGFCTWGMGVDEHLKFIYRIIREDQKLNHTKMYVYGEWFGPGINKGVAVNQLAEKKFGVFDIVFVDEIGNSIHIDPVQYHELFNGTVPNIIVIDAIIPPAIVTIDFANPSASQNKLLELTLAVEAECPVGKFFGVSGVGEGIVYKCSDDETLPLMKVKGEKHSASKVSTVRELTDAEIASKANATEFVEYACTENRMRQGIDKLGEMGLPVDVKSMGAYLKWLGGDILSECKDVLIESKIDRKDVMPRVADKGRNWFLTYINSGL